jgi:RecB family exonuclease
LEKKFTYKLGGKIIKGTIDRVDRLPDGTLEIIDYKTGTVKNALTSDSKIQLTLYQLVLEELFGVKVSRLTYYYVEGPQRLSFVAKPEFLNKVRQEAITKMMAISEGKFPPTPGMACSFCDFNKICPYRAL